jgi:hypothetical protein
MIICSNTGNVKEVEFDFIRTTGYATIPVATYRRLELALKEQVRFPPTAFGRRMNFIVRSVRMDVAQIIREQGVTPPNSGPGIGVICDCPIGPIGPMRGEENEVLEENQILEETEVLE